jgi:hypothetical protein
MALAGAAAVGLAAAGALAGSASAAPAHTAHASEGYKPLSVRTVLSGKSLSHKNTKTGQSEALTQPDDIVLVNGNLYVAFQNGVGSKGEVAPDGNTASTVVEFSPDGTVLAQADVTGKVDGMGGDATNNQAVVTVNEDGNSSLYTISGATATHYRYSAHLAHNGGTDAISFYQGQMLVSASAPGSTGKAAPQATYPAVYSVTLDSMTGVATATPYYYDESSASTANGGHHLGKHVHLALTDPDSSEVVPGTIARFAGDFMLNSQGDQELIFDSSPHSLWVLALSQSIDDAAFPTQWYGAIFATDSHADAVVAIDGRPLWPRSVFAAVTPCNANSAPSVCPAKGFPAPYLGLVNLYTGSVTKVNVHGSVQPKGMVFVPNATP